MPANGTEVTSETKVSQPALPESRNTRTATDGKPPAVRGAVTRRRRERQDSTKPNPDERFFLASTNRNGDAPALGRECHTEAEAIIDAFREKVNFYKLSEFQTRADIGPSGEPILRKEALKKSSPAS